MYMQDGIACMINICKWKFPKILNTCCTYTSSYKYDNKLSSDYDSLSRVHYTFLLNCIGCHKCKIIKISNYYTLTIVILLLYVCWAQITS